MEFLRKNTNLMFFIVAMVLVYAVITGSRLYQYQTAWVAEPENYYVDDIPMTNTLDAYKYVRIAEEIKAGTYDVNEKDMLMHYPDGWERENRPLLSTFIVWASEVTGDNFFQAALRLMPFLAGLFIIPFGIFFYRLNAPVAGILGGFLAAFAFTYYGRSTPGRIDTDSLNMFFVFLIPLLIAIAAEAKNSKKVYLFSALAGLTQLLFIYAYQHTMFILVNLLVLIITLALNRQRKGVVVISSILFLLFCNPVFFYASFLNAKIIIVAYFSDSFSSGLPNVYSTVSETSGAKIVELIGRIFLNPVCFFFGVAGLVLLAFRDFKRVFPLAFPFALGMLCFVLAERFSMYLIPFLGAGVGYIFSYAASKLPENVVPKVWVKQLASYALAVCFVLFVSIAPADAAKGIIWYFKPYPSIEPVLYNSFNIMKEKLPEKSVIYSWWDFGLAIEAQTGFATFHDGMVQNLPNTWLIAKGFVEDQHAMYKYITYLTNEGGEKLSSTIDNISGAGFLEVLENYDEKLREDKIHVVYTQDMIQKYGALQYIGNWDVISQKPVQHSTLDILYCNPTKSTTLQCERNAVINMDLFLIGQSQPVKSIDYVDIKTGAHIGKRESDYISPIRIIALQDDGTTYLTFVMDDRAYNSSFTQMFLLGQYDKDLYEMVIDIYPLNRTFRVKAE